MAVVSMRNLLEAGVHFGHQTRRWNPKMKPYIFTERNGIYILDLQRTLREIEAAYTFTRDTAARGRKMLFVGTKKQAQEPIQSEAERSGMPFVNQRWLGGMLTNFVTMRQRIQRLEELEAMEEDGTMEKLPKKEQMLLRKEHAKLDRNLSGVRTMTELPSIMFVVDTKREAIAVAEARRLHIPIIGLVDTNADPDEVDFVIPGNDDAIRSVGLMCRMLADAVLEGRAASEGPAVLDTDPAPEPLVVSATAEIVEESPAEQPAEVAAEPEAAPEPEAAADVTEAEPEAVPEPEAAELGEPEVAVDVAEAEPEAAPEPEAVPEPDAEETAAE